MPAHLPDGQSHEGEAAMQLEALARRSTDAGAYPYATDGEEIDPAPMFHALAADMAAGLPAEDMALRFHRFVAAAFADAARAWIETGNARAIVLSGGCFQNAVLARLMQEELRGLPVLTHRTTPANDGGLALGQAVIAAARALQRPESG